MVVLMTGCVSGIVMVRLNLHGNAETMEDMYRRYGDTHKMFDDMHRMYENRYPTDPEWRGEIWRSTLRSHADALDDIEDLEDDFLSEHPDDEDLATLIEGRRAERTAVVKVGIRDMMTSPNVDVLVTTATPVRVATPSAKGTPPSVILAKNVIFGCERLRMIFGEMVSVGETEGYSYLGQVMSMMEDESGRSAHFNSYDAKMALEECGQ